MKSDDFLRMPVWYPILAEHAFVTSFVKLRPEAVGALASGAGADGAPSEEWEKTVRAVISDLAAPMALIPGNCFTSVDCCSPTDTERFERKRGAVYSPRSAWRFLAASAKVRAAAERGEVEYICLRPFRRITKPREFRLFIRGGKLNAMSQYHLLRHFRRLEGVREHYWKLAQEFVDSIAWKLPGDDLVMDIYITGEEKVLIIDLNPWGGATDPLLLRSWDRDWSEPAGIVLMEPPYKLRGEVNVSF